MPKKATTEALTLKGVLSQFDLKLFKRWLQKHSPLIWKSFKSQNEEVQMATMCKQICDRTDLLDTEAHKKAVEWLKKHNMKGRLF